MRPGRQILRHILDMPEQEEDRNERIMIKASRGKIFFFWIQYIDRIKLADCEQYFRILYINRNIFIRLIYRNDKIDQPRIV